MRAGTSAVKKLAQERGLQIMQPQSLKDAAVLAHLAAVRPEALVVAAYGLILPPPVLGIAPLGALNIHASLLPRWRGAAPIQRALLAGDRETGITIIRMDAGLDTGPVLSSHPLAIDPNDDARTLHDRLAGLGARAILAALESMSAAAPVLRPQPDAGSCYAPRLSTAEAELDWAKSCVELERAVRAFRPVPGARTLWHGEPLKLWRTSCMDGQGLPGEVLDVSDDGIVVACGTGALRVQELQRAGGTRLVVADFLRGHPIKRGERLGAPR